MNDGQLDTEVAPRRRAAALGALLAGGAAVVTAGVGLWGDVGRALLAGVSTAPCGTVCGTNWRVTELLEATRSELLMEPEAEIGSSRRGSAAF